MHPNIVIIINKCYQRVLCVTIKNLAAINSLILIFSCDKVSASSHLIRFSWQQYLKNVLRVHGEKSMFSQRAGKGKCGVASD